MLSALIRFTNRQSIESLIEICFIDNNNTVFEISGKKESLIDSESVDDNKHFNIGSNLQEINDLSRKLNKYLA